MKVVFDIVTTCRKLFLSIVAVLIRGFLTKDNLEIETHSENKLAFLNDLIGLNEYKVDAVGNYENRNISNDLFIFKIFAYW
jgi:hypothetical protein